MIQFLLISLLVFGLAITGVIAVFKIKELYNRNQPKEETKNDDKRN